MEENRNLNAKQKSIIAIAAFTANGDLEKLRTASCPFLARVSSIVSKRTSEQ